MSTEEFVLKLCLLAGKQTGALIDKDFEVIRQALAEEFDCLKEYILSNDLFEDEHKIDALENKEDENED